MREADLQKSVRRWLKSELPADKSFFWKASDRYIAGIPDIVGCYDGLMWAIELKVGSNKPTKLQDITLSALRGAGALTQVCYSLAEVKDFIAIVRNSTEFAYKVQDMVYLVEEMQDFNDEDRDKLERWFENEQFVKRAVAAWDRYLDRNDARSDIYWNTCRLALIDVLDEFEAEEV